MPLIVSGAVPELVTVTVFAALVVPTSCEANGRAAGGRRTAGAGTTAAPERRKRCGLPDALSLTSTLALRAPPPVGENVTEIVQLALGASEDGQSLVCAKSPALAPLVPMLLIDSDPLPVFVSVTVFAALVVPTSCE